MYRKHLLVDSRALHVAIERFKDLYHQNSLLSMNHLLSRKEHHIVHTSWQDSGHSDNKVGKVVESFIGNYGSKCRGLDFALVRNCINRKESILFYFFFLI